MAPDNSIEKISTFPALIVAYKRLENTEKLINDCIKFGCPKIYLAVDKSTGSRNLQQEFYDLAERIHQRTLIPIYLWNRNKNYGLAASMITGISWFFEYEENGYVLEDDLEVSESFFLWSSSLLEKARYNEDIWLVSGNNYQDTNTVECTNYPLIWGWATSKSKWKQILASILYSAPDFNSSVNLTVRAYWTLNYKKAAVGVVDSWAMLLAATMRGHNKLCILPPTNMVSNLGSDLAATHTQINVWPLREPIKDSPIHLFDEMLLPTEPNHRVNQFIELDIYGINKLKFRWILSIAFFKARKNSKLAYIADLIDKEPEIIKFEMSR